MKDKKIVKAITAGFYALAEENIDILSLLEEQGPIVHKGISAEEARLYLGSDQ